MRGFALAGADRRFYWANAVVAGRTVWLTSPKVPRPVAVRYAWSNTPECESRRRGLPALPFPHG